MPVPADKPCLRGYRQFITKQELRKSGDQRVPGMFIRLMILAISTIIKPFTAI